RELVVHLPGPLEAKQLPTLDRLAVFVHVKVADVAVFGATLLVELPVPDEQRPLLVFDVRAVRRDVRPRDHREEGDHRPPQPDVTHRPSFFNLCSHGPSCGRDTTTPGPTLPPAWRGPTGSLARVVLGSRGLRLSRNPRDPLTQDQPSARSQ